MIYRFLVWFDTVLHLGRKFDAWYDCRATNLHKAGIILAFGLILFLLAWLPEWRKKK